MSFYKYYFTEDKFVPSLILTIAIPGAGKSTWIKSFNKNNKYIVVNPDKIRKELTGNISDVSRDSEVWAIAKKRVVDALENGQDVILDATNVHTGRRNNFIEDLPEVQIKAKFIDIDPEEAKRRIHKDIENGIDRSNVPDEVIDRMYKDYLDTKKMIKYEPIEIIE